MSEPTGEVPVRASGVLRKENPAAAENLASSVNAVHEGLSSALLDMSSDQQDRLLDAMRNLQNGVFARGASQNLRNPEFLITAFEGASALLSPEPVTQNKPGAEKIIGVLQQRYSLK